jgi:RND family efflux transporter MFP subunit
LARLDEQDFRNKLTSAEADVTAAQAELTEAQATEARQSELVKTGATSVARLDEAVRNRRSAEAKLKSAQASLDLAKDQLNYTELKAEFDGVVTAVGAEVGQVVGSGQMVVRVARPEEKDGVFSVAEAAFRDQTNERPEVSVWLLGSPYIKADGVVREISPVADPVTRTYTVKVGLKNPPDQMRLGMSIVGRLKLESAPVVVLPLGAIFQKNGTPAVWVFHADTGSVELSNVTVARFEADHAVIGEGLAKGDVVVTAGVNRLREGQKVRLAEAGQK